MSHIHTYHIHTYIHIKEACHVSYLLTRHLSYKYIRYMTRCIWDMTRCIWDMTRLHINVSYMLTRHLSYTTSHVSHIFMYKRYTTSHVQRIYNESCTNDTSHVSYTVEQKGQELRQLRLSFLPATTIQTSHLTHVAHMHESCLVYIHLQTSHVSSCLVYINESCLVTHIPHRH